MSASRIEALRKMLASRPADPRLRFGLALEYLAAGDLAAGVDELRLYLEATEDEGNAWGRLGSALRQLGRDEEAKDAYRQGMAAAERHGHPTMAEEFAELLAHWDA
jgi:E3 SUMO-protein ligase RanBP2